MNPTTVVSSFSQISSLGLDAVLLAAGSVAVNPESGWVALLIALVALAAMEIVLGILMIGVMLVAEGFGTHFNKNYIYFAMAFSLGVELLNLRLSRKPVGDLPQALKSQSLQS